MLHIVAMYGDVTSGVVTLSDYNHSVSAPASSFTGAQVIIRTDGTVDSGAGRTAISSPVQRNASTDWIIPNSAATSTYEVKIEQVSVTGSAMSPSYHNDSGSGKRLSTWVALTTDRWWGTYTTTGGTVTTWTITVHIRLGSGSEIDSCQWALTNNNLG